MTNTLRLVDGDTTIILRPNMPSRADPIVVQSHELTMPTPRVLDQVRAGRSGVDDLTQYHDAAVFKAALIVRGDGALTRHQYMDLLRGLAAPYKRPYLYIQRDGWPSERRAMLRGDPVTSVVERHSVVRLEASIQFQIPGGVLEAPDPLSSVTIRPTIATTGKTYPVTYPKTYVAGGGSATLVTSGGNVPTPPLLRLYGTCTDPVIRNVTTGQQLEFDNISIAAGNYLEVDVEARTVLLNGDPALSYYSKLNFTTSDWWDLQPGANLITVATGSQDASCELDLYYRDRWI
jgi:hypothetical protein